jgi:DNA topoisomerase IB
MRLRRVDCGSPGITRKRRGRGFAYYWSDGSKVEDPDTLTRIQALVLPPAWQDVWICPWPNGHVQALGTDAAGTSPVPLPRRLAPAARRREARARAGGRRATARARRIVAEDLAAPVVTRERALACAFRLLDLGFFRVGSEQYAEDNGTFGLATMRREHVSVTGDVVVFEYTAKSGKHRVQSLVDDDVRATIRTLLRRRNDPNPELLAYKVGSRWVDVKSHDINDYLRQVVGAEISAKDFRTWHATVLMAVALAVSKHVPQTESARKRAVSRAVTEVAQYLGNTPAVCRSSYIDPRVVDLFYDGITIYPALERLGRPRGLRAACDARHDRGRRAQAAEEAGQVDAEAGKDRLSRPAESPSSCSRVSATAAAIAGCSSGS